MLHENLNQNNPLVPYDVQYTDSHLMVADVHTKGFTDPNKWLHAQMMAGIVEPCQLEEKMRYHKQWFNHQGKMDPTPKGNEVNDILGG